MRLLRDAFGGWTRWNPWNWRGFRGLRNNPAIKIGGGGSWRACLGLGSRQVGDETKMCSATKVPSWDRSSSSIVSTAEEVSGKDAQVRTVRSRIPMQGWRRAETGRRHVPYPSHPIRYPGLTELSFLPLSLPASLSFPLDGFFPPTTCRTISSASHCLLRLPLGLRPAVCVDTAPNALKRTAS